MAAINALRLCISENADNESLCLLNVNIHNAFNEYCHSTFLSQVRRHFPLLFGGVTNPQLSFASVKLVFFVVRVCNKMTLLGNFFFFLFWLDSSKQ